MNREEMRKILNGEDNIEVLAENNGVKVMSYDDVAIANVKDTLDDRVDVSTRKINPDGSLARTKVSYAGVNLGMYFDNRYYLFEEDGKQKLGVVIDNRAIDEQKTGRLYAKLVTAYIIVRGADKKLKLDKVTNVSDTDFMANYKDKLDIDAMKKVMPLIRANRINVEEKKMPI